MTTNDSTVTDDTDPMIDLSTRLKEVGVDFDLDHLRIEGWAWMIDEDGARCGLLLDDGVEVMATPQPTLVDEHSDGLAEPVGKPLALTTVRNGEGEIREAREIMLALAARAQELGGDMLIRTDKNVEGDHDLAVTRPSAFGGYTTTPVLMVFTPGVVRLERLVED